VRHARALIPLALTLVALALAACGGDGDGDGDATTSPAPSEAPSGGTTAPSPGQLPPQLVECFAKRGYKVESPADVHSAPPEVAQECFGALHEGGGAP
jgi:hypothetical protein